MRNGEFGIRNVKRKGAGKGNFPAHEEAERTDVARKRAGKEDFPARWWRRLRRYMGRRSTAALPNRAFFYSVLASSRSRSRSLWIISLMGFVGLIE